METTPWWRDSYPKATWRVFEDFRVFLKLTWSHLNLPKPTRVQLDIAYYLQHGPKRAIIQAFRGVGKSWITSAYVCWLLLRDPQLNIMVVSASKDRADQFTTFTLRLISEIDLLRHLMPRSDQRCSKIAFDVAPADADHAPSVRSVGVMGQMTGGRADIIIPDDVEVPNNSETVMMREKLSERVKEFDAILKPGGRIMYLGTPQTEESLYNALLDRGYACCIWPAKYPDEEKRKNYGDRLAPWIVEEIEKDAQLVGRSTDPDRFHEQDLREREASYGRSGFALQFMLDTRLSDQDRHPLKLNDLVVMDVDRDEGPEKVVWANDDRYVHKDLPIVGFNGDRFHMPMDFGRDEFGNVRRKEYQGRVMVIDPSGRGKDETAWNITYMLNSQVFLPEQGGTRDGYSEKTLEFLAKKAKEHRVKLIRIESNFGDGMFAALLNPYLQRIYPCTVEEDRATGQKEKRIVDTLEPVLNQHRLIVDRKLIKDDYESVNHLPPEEAKNYRLMFQLSHVTKDKGALGHDDRLDALAIAVGYWVEQMGVDIEKQIEEHRQQALDLELERFTQTVYQGDQDFGGSLSYSWM